MQPATSSSTSSSTRRTSGTESRSCLCPWQEEALCQIFGQLDDSGNRIIEMVYLRSTKEVRERRSSPRASCLLVLLMSHTQGCQVYGAASATRQAMNVYRAACKMVEQSPLLKKRLRILRGTNRIVKRSDPDSFYAAIAADGDVGDGVNPACVIADELHRWKTRKQIENWDVLSNGGITRRQTLTIAITTAGVQNESPLAWRLHEKTRKVEAGIVSDPKFYGRIYGAAKEDDPADPATWIKANPSLKQNGGFLDIEKIREQYVSHAAEGDLTIVQTLLPEHVGPEGIPRHRSGPVGRLPQRLAGGRASAEGARGFNPPAAARPAAALHRTPLLGRRRSLDEHGSFRRGFRVSRATTAATTSCRSSGRPQRR